MPGDALAPTAGFLAPEVSCDGFALRSLVVVGDAKTVLLPLATVIDTPFARLAKGFIFSAVERLLVLEEVCNPPAAVFVKVISSCSKPFKTSEPLVACTDGELRTGLFPDEALRQDATNEATDGVD